jgi:hypothetical protein
MTRLVTVTDRTGLAQALRTLKLSGMLATLDARLAQAAAGDLRLARFSFPILIGRFATLEGMKIKSVIPMHHPMNMGSSGRGGTSGTSRPGWNREGGPVPVPAVKRKPTVSHLTSSRHATDERPPEHGRRPGKYAMPLPTRCSSPVWCNCHAWRPYRPLRREDHSGSEGVKRPAGQPV